MNAEMKFGSIEFPAAALLSAVALVACGGGGDTDAPVPLPPETVLVAWTTADGDGRLGAMSTRAPWQFTGAPLTIGSDATLRCANGDLFVSSQSDGTIALVDISTQYIQLIASLGPSEPMDIVAVDTQTAYVTRRSATHLLRLDIKTGATTEVVDLRPFADSDGVPDLGMMATHEGRLFVQIRRDNSSAGLGYTPPPYIAVVDLASEQLVDTEPGIPGVQAIELLGTHPKHKMQVVSETSELFVSASGVMHDQGGIEVIDLETLRSKGLVISEAFDAIGADLGPFVMVTPDEGFLVSSTDWDASSHLQRFTIDGGVDPPPDLAQSIGYAAPSIVLDSRGKTLFFPSGQHDKMGIYAIDVTSGTLLTQELSKTSGIPSDVLPACSDVAR